MTDAQKVHTLALGLPGQLSIVAHNVWSHFALWQWVCDTS